MTNKEKVILDVSSKTGFDVSVVSKVFEIVNNKDWKDFCSYMGDYDHPSERVRAEEVFNSEMNDYSNESGISFNELKNISDKIVGSELYHSKFHHMNDEYFEILK